MVNVAVKFFASCREAVGINETRVDASNVEEVLSILRNQYPRLTLTLGEISIALNTRYLKSIENVQLREGDVVALLPPISGG